MVLEIFSHTRCKIIIYSSIEFIINLFINIGLLFVLEFVVTVKFNNEHEIDKNRYKRCTALCLFLLTGDISPPEYTETSSGQNQNKSWHSKRRVFHVCVNPVNS